MPARCSLCDAACPEERYCAGCGSYICDDCDFGAPTSDSHDAEDHDGDGDEEDEGEA